jgi:uncharacterized protein (TIGR03000 family)
MVKTRLSGMAFVVISAGALLLGPTTSEAQRRGWGWGPGGYDPWGYHSNGGSASAPRSAVPAVPAALQYYPGEELTDPTAAAFTLRLPDANAEVWFENQKTQQKGILREYVSGSLDPKSSYTFHLKARWMENGRPVEQTRNIDARAGQRLTVDFTSSDPSRR